MGWLSGWTYRRPIQVTAGSNGMPAGYQLKITIDTASLIAAGKMRSDGGDIRFTKADGVTLLSYWIESGINTTSTIIWVKDPDALSANASHVIYMYYGNPSATSQSSGANTFDDFDDFLTNTLANYVQIYSGWSIDTTPPGYLKSPSSGEGFIAKSKSLSRAYAVRARFYMSTSDAGIGFIWGTAGGGESSVNGYIANYYTSTTYSQLRKYSAGSFTALASLPVLSSGWYVMELRITSSTIIVIRGTTQDASATDTTFTTLSGVGFRQKAASTIALDWWALRKYVDPEPTVSVSTTEEYMLIVSDSGSGVELVEVNVTTVVSDAGAGVEAVDMSRDMVDSGVGVEAIDMAKELLDSGIGYDYFTGGLYKLIDDSGAGAESVGMAKELIDSGLGIELINMSKAVLDFGNGAESILSPRYNPLTDSGIGAEASTVKMPQNDAGAGAEASTVIGTIPAFDSGLGIDIITQMVKMVIDSGAGVDAVYISARVFVLDSGIGADIIGIVAYIPAEDLGKGEDFADWFLSIYGMVLVDNEQVGIHSIPYKDWKKNNIPVQVHRRSVEDKVYIDDDDIGDVVVEWEDKVSDVVPGERTVIVTGVVELYD